MDRRQRKSREAILKAFIELLSQKNVNQITVSEIIERADVGRATFYAHFETKDFLLKELLEELFCHIFDVSTNSENDHRHLFECNSDSSVFLHLFEHLQKNDNQILALLNGDNNELFLRYFKEGLKELISDQISLFDEEKSKKLPTDFYVNHIASVFVETVRWWINDKMRLSPQEITEYFFIAV